MDHIENLNIESKSSRKNKIENISFFIILFTTFILPLIFTSYSFSPIDLAKYSVITYGTLISSILLVFAVYKSKKITLNKNIFSISAISIALSIIVSTLFSTNISKSFFGQGFEIGTGSFMLIIIITSFIYYLFIKEKIDRVIYVYSALIVSYIAIYLFLLIRLVTGADFLDFNVFYNLSITPIGKFTDLSIFSAVILLISYFSQKILSLDRTYKIFSNILIILSSILVLISNSGLVLNSLVLIFLIIIYSDFISSKTSKTGILGIISKISIIPLIILVVFLLFSWKGDRIISFVVNKLNVNNIELYLPWQYTLDIATESIKENPILGAGPNRFTNQYLKFKPEEINPTQFYNVEFSNGFGTIPSLIVTQGLFGFISWMIFIIAFIYLGFVSIIKKDRENDYLNFVRLSSYFSSVLLIIFNFIYTPGHVIMFITAIFVAIFISTLKIGKDCELENKKLNIVLIIALLILTIWIGYSLKKTISLLYFENGIKQINQEDIKGIDSAHESFSKALSYDKNDTYYQALSENNLIKINYLLSELNKLSPNSDTEKIAPIRDQVMKLIDESVINSRKAVEFDVYNYYNHLSEARVLDLASSLKIDGAYENAKRAYENAIIINPRNPSTYLQLARLELSRENIDGALPYIGYALQLKSNYLDAVFLLAQIQVAQGKTKDAIESVKYATKINPNDPTLFFQLGILEYNNKSYTNAINSFTQALKLNNQYANAQYFLGLSYARTNNVKDAIINFEALEISNPDNDEVKLILRNLRAGRPIFADAVAPIDSKPESRKTLPIQEKKTTVKKSTLTR